MKRLIITEQEKYNILKMYDLLSEDIKRPLQKLMECKFTTDGKYIIYEGKAFLTSTGEQVPINEAWTLSDILHAGADVLSAGLDFVIPGSGAVVDTLNAISYLIEAQFKSNEEKDSLYLMAAITFAFVILPGPLQAISIPLKRAITTGVGMTSPIVKKGLKIIGGSIESLLVGIPSRISTALKSPLAKKILGNWGTKISGFIDNFTSRIKQLFEKLTGKAGKESSKVVAKGTLTKNTKTLLGNFFKNVPKISRGSFVLKKLGFVVGKPYRYVGKSGKATTATIKEITDNGVKVAYKNGTTTMVPVETFVKNAVGTPWMRRGYSVLVPLFIKRLSDIILPDGSIDYNKLETLPDLNPDETSEESLSYLQEEVADYQGDEGKYVSNENVTNFQKALKMLDFNLGNFGPNKDGVDGKFGPQTQTALKEFQTQNGLESSLGKMDRLTAEKLSEVLKTKNINGSEEIQNYLSSL